MTLKAANRGHDEALEAIEAERKKLATLDREIERLDEELAEIERQVAEAHGKREPVGPLRKRRREVKGERDDLQLERPLLERRVHEAESKANAALVELHLEQRRSYQRQGVTVSCQIRQLTQELSGRLKRWDSLAERDGRCKNIIRSASPGRVGELPNFSWATALDAHFQEAIRSLVREEHRAEGELRRRSLAKAG